MEYLNIPNDRRNLYVETIKPSEVFTLFTYDSQRCIEEEKRSHPGACFTKLTKKS